MDFYLDIVNSALIISVLGFSLNFLIGYTGLISMAQGALFGVGAYATAIAATRMGLNLPLTVLLSVAVAAIGFTLLAWPALRVRGEYLILLTLAVQFVLVGVYTSWSSVTGGNSGIGSIPRPTWFSSGSFPSSGDLLPFTGIIFVIGLLFSLWVGHSPFGRTLRAIRENESAAESIGKNITYYKVAIFLLAGILAGLAGSVYAHYRAFVSPVTFSLDQSIFIIAVIVLGGVGSILGTIVGSFVLVAFPQLLLLLELDNQIAAMAQRFAYGVLLVLFMIYRPQGIVPESLRMRALLRRRSPTKATESLTGPQTSKLPDAGAPDDPVARSEDLKLKPTASSASSPNGSTQANVAPVVVGTDLYKSFGGVRPADGLSIQLLPGRVTALVGANGAGKTTLFNLLTGAIKLDAGQVTLHGQDVTRLAPWRRTQRGLSRTFQDVRVFEGMRVIDNVAVAIPRQPGDRLSSLFGRPLATWRGRARTRDQALEYLRFVGLADRADDLVSSLAFAEQKLVSVARLLATEADVLLLDEPASGVDRKWVDVILERVRELAATGRTVCLVEHNLDIVRAAATHAYFMDAGKIIAEGTPEELMHDPYLASIYFGVGKGRGEATHADG